MLSHERNREDAEEGEAKKDHEKGKIRGTWRVAERLARATPLSSEYEYGTHKPVKARFQVKVKAGIWP